MAEKTFLNNVDESKVENLLNEVEINSKYFTDMTEKVVKSYTEDLDNLMFDLMRDVTGEEAISSAAAERYYAELTNMVYFMSDKVEKLNVYNDMSKAAAKEVYNKSYLAFSSEKDEKGKSIRTVAENTAASENTAQYNYVVNSIYEHAYKTVKMKIDAANEMITTLKNILKIRSQEEYMNSMTANQRTNFSE